MKPILILAALLATTPAVAANLVSNGGFSSGNSGFTSYYTYFAPSAHGGEPESVYTVDTNAINDHPAWFSFGDHTTGTGNYMIVNGATAKTIGAGISPVTWQETVTVAANTKHFLRSFCRQPVLQLCA